MKKLEVHYEGWEERWLLGTLADNGRALLFEYSKEALKQRLELSPVNLKLRTEAYGEFPTYLDRLPGLIHDALPDGWGLLLMDRVLKKHGLSLSEISPLDRLAYLGSRATGALTFTPATESRPMSGKFSLTDVAREVQKIISGKSTDALSEIAEIGGSPHGARPKALMKYDRKTRMISSDIKGAGDPWLFKFPAAQEHKEVCAIEVLYNRLALKCGLQVRESEYFDLGKNGAAFGVERFDWDAGYRVPIHTVAGALNADFRLPSVDYVTFLRLTRRMTNDQREVNRAYLQCVFNVVFHNRDDHPKNISFRLDRERQWKLSPAYDLTFSSGPGGEHQMDVCGEGKNPAREHLTTLAQQTGVAPKVAKEIIENVCTTAMRFKSLAADFAIRKDTVEQMAARITINRKRVVGDR